MAEDLSTHLPADYQIRLYGASTQGSVCGWRSGGKHVGPGDLGLPGHQSTCAGHIVTRSSPTEGGNIRVIEVPLRPTRT